MAKHRKVLIMAGGTGGHVFPGLAVAKLLQEQGVEVHWLGTQKGVEARLVPAANIPLHFIGIHGLRGKGFKDIFAMPYRLNKAIFQSLKILRELKPDVVLGMGGFVSGPGGIACWLSRTPLVIHEQNAKVGLTNKWLAKFAKKIMQGFPDTFVESHKVVTTGNPVRVEIAAMQPPEQRFAARENSLRLLVVGGSLGAAAFNEMVPKALKLLTENIRPLVHHQSGEKNFAETLKHYETNGVRGDVVPFIAAMDEAYRWADLVLCRAGALTIAELCAAGLGAILVPYPYAVDGHQTSNANYLVKNNAGVLIQQTELTAERLANILRNFSEKPEERLSMAKASYQLRKIDATNKVVEIIKRCADKTNSATL